MQAAEPKTAGSFPLVDDKTILAQIAEVRGKIRSQKHHAVNIWRNCKPDAELNVRHREELGRYTQQLLRKKENA